MADQNVTCNQYEETFKQAAVEFLNKSESLEAAASELGVNPADLRAWKKKMCSAGKSSKKLRGVARLQAENEALRNQVLSLQMQWDILKTTLGVLSTTVCTHELI